MPDKFLPIGTVCTLKGSNQMIAITGFCMKNENIPDKVFDYVACFFPQGVYDLSKNILFDHNQIDRILYLGYVNEEEKIFKQKVNELLKTREPKEEKQYDESVYDMNVPVTSFVSEE